MIAIIDYGAGNIKSVENALKMLGQETMLTKDANQIACADRVVLPGVGSFGDAMERIRKEGLEEVIQDICHRGTPFLGICLGLQLLFEESEESPGVKGLSILPGKIVRFPKDMPDVLQEKQSKKKGNVDHEDRKEGYSYLKVPEIGWNELYYPKNNNPRRLFAGVPEHSYVYFVHSYYLKSSDPSIVAAKSDYGLYFDASVEKDNIFACQFHPEKSERIGMKMLKNFLEVPTC